jgi:thiol-disulfide isomerase/thioredoxin
MLKNNRTNSCGLALACLFMASSIIPVTARDSDQTSLKHLSLADFVSEDSQLLDVRSGKVSREVLKGKFVGVYFSAHWCGPCRSFTPILQKFRDANKENFEVVFLSMDIDRANRSRNANLAKKKEYVKSANMNWYTIDCDYPTSYKSFKKSGRRGIPTLVVFSPDGKYVTNNGKNDVKNDPKTALPSWREIVRSHR